MRLLFLDVNGSFVNPTRNLLPGILGRVGRLDCFGPGYVPSETLAAGLPAFVDRHGPYDAILATSMILHAKDAGSPGDPTGWGNYVLRCPFEDLAHRSRIRTEMARIDVPRVAVLLESDYYFFGEFEIGRIADTVDWVIGFGPELYRPIAENPGLAAEHFAGAATDRWVRFAEAWRDRFVSVPHFVGDNEFAFTPLGLRRHAWAVPGARYAARREAFAALKAAGVEPDRYTPLRIRDILARLRLIRRDTVAIQALTNALFRRRLEDSRYVFTCGSGLSMPLRKYFEIPAAGAVMVCLPCHGFEALGFVDGESAVVAPPDSLPEVHRMLEADPERAQAIATAGRDLVLRAHTASARAEQIKAALEAIVAGRFAGTCWRGGELTLVPPHPERTEHGLAR